MRRGIQQRNSETPITFQAGIRSSFNSTHVVLYKGLKLQGFLLALWEFIASWELYRRTVGTVINSKGKVRLKGETFTNLLSQVSDRQWQCHAKVYRPLFTEHSRQQQLQTVVAISFVSSPLLSLHSQHDSAQVLASSLHLNIHAQKHLISSCLCFSTADSELWPQTLARSVVELVFSHALRTLKQTPTFRRPPTDNQNAELISPSIQHIPTTTRWTNSKLELESQGDNS